jgi:hypothetical protein
LGWSNESETRLSTVWHFCSKEWVPHQVLGGHMGTSPLRDQYPCLYSIARHKQITVVDVFSTSPFNLSWHRYLIGPKLVAWNELLP